MRKCTLTLLICLCLGILLFAGSDEEDIQVLFSGQFHGPWLGVKVRDLNSEELDEISTMDDLGVFIVSVVEDSPAEKAGVKENDIIVRLGGIPVLGKDHFVQLVRSSSSGRTFTILVYREGKTTPLKVTLSKRKSAGLTRQLMPEITIPRVKAMPFYQRGFEVFSAVNRPRLGIYYEDITEQLANFFGVKDGTGVLITSVIEDSPAEQAGLSAGDVIVEVNGSKVEVSEDLIKILRDCDGDKPLAITVVRKGKIMEFDVKTRNKKEKREQGRFSI